MILKGQSSQILNLSFDIHIWIALDLLVKKNLRGSHDFRERTTFFLQLGTNTFGNIIFLGNF
jgi:hypothetical protein